MESDRSGGIVSGWLGVTHGVVAGGQEVELGPCDRLDRSYVYMNTGVLDVVC